jgi:beta-phosphoglucomutase-like phosphatase (HAD superfamily)
MVVAVRAKTAVMLDLPDTITTCLFDLDGVLTQTAKIHAQAWKQMFDDFLREWSERTGEPFHEFDRPTDYDDYVDGKPRLDGVRSFRAELTCRWGRRPIRPRRRPSMRSGHARTASCSS